MTNNVRIPKFSSLNEVYQFLINCSKRNVSFSIDLKLGNLIIDNMYVMIGYNVVQSFKSANFTWGEYRTVDEVRDNIEELFNIYYNSYPSKGSESKYFASAKMGTINDNGIERAVAKAALEGYVLCQVTSGNFGWFEKLHRGKSFYWQSEKYPKLILLRDWIEK